MKNTNPIQGPFTKARMAERQTGYSTAWWLAMAIISVVTFVLVVVTS